MTENSSRKCVIALDAMGGDFAPLNEIEGLFLALPFLKNSDVLLVGKKEEIIAVLEKKNLKFNYDKIINAHEVITMHDSPAAAVKTKKNSSIVIGAKLVKDKIADAFVSAGNTGAMMTASTMIMGRIPGVGRPTIGAPLPSQTGVCMVYDVGASVDCKPQHLLEYSIMGTIYFEEIFGKNNPTIALLNVGEEESKGNELSKETYGLLKTSGLNFIGNAEGKDILKGKADIVVCDGFTGNVLLKFAEAVIPLLKVRIKSYIGKSIVKKLKNAFLRQTMKEALQDFDPELHGGVPLLGVNGISIIGHGSGSAVAIKNMLLRAEEMHTKELLKKFEEAIRKYGKQQ